LHAHSVRKFLNNHSDPERQTVAPPVDAAVVDRSRLLMNIKGDGGAARTMLP
jgi:hypothetical protein